MAKKILKGLLTLILFPIGSLLSIGLVATLLAGVMLCSPIILLGATFLASQFLSEKILRFLTHRYPDKATLQKLEKKGYLTQDINQTDLQLGSYESHWSKALVHTLLPLFLLPVVFIPVVIAVTAITAVVGTLLIPAAAGVISFKMAEKTVNAFSKKSEKKDIEKPDSIIPKPSYQFEEIRGLIDTFNKRRSEKYKSHGTSLFLPTDNLSTSKIKDSKPSENKSPTL